MPTAPAAPSLSIPVPRPPQQHRRVKAFPGLPARQSDGDEDYRTTILALLRDAQQHGGNLRSLELGEALKSLFGQASYDRFREDGLKKAVARLGFRVTDTKSGFDVEMP